MPLDRMALHWVLFAFACGIALYAYDSHSLIHASTIGDIYSLPPSIRVEFSGEISNFRTSGGAWVFDVVNQGRITCYFRHPPSTIFPFNHDHITLRGRIDSTSRGRLCVVEEWLSHVSTP